MRERIAWMIAGAACAALLMTVLGAGRRDGTVVADIVMTKELRIVGEKDQGEALLAIQNGNPLIWLRGQGKSRVEFGIKENEPVMYMFNGRGEATIRMRAKNDVSSLRLAHFGEPVVQASIYAADQSAGVAAEHGGVRSRVTVNETKAMWELRRPGGPGLTATAGEKSSGLVLGREGYGVHLEATWEDSTACIKRDGNDVWSAP